MSANKFSESEWSVEDWTNEWTIGVGKAYTCTVCGNMVMVIKGGVGIMEPKCCSRDMLEVKRADDKR